MEEREQVRRYTQDVDQRSTWLQRSHAELYPHAGALPEGSRRWSTMRPLLEPDDSS